MNMRRVNRIDQLAQNVPPARDLWPAISSAIAADIEAAAAAAAANSAPRRARWMPAVGMAAAVALVTLGVFIGRISTPTPDTVAGLNPAQGEANILPAALRDANYRKQRDALLVEVNNQLKAMPPAEREKVAAIGSLRDSSVGRWADKPIDRSRRRKGKCRGASL